MHIYKVEIFNEKSSLSHTTSFSVVWVPVVGPAVVSLNTHIYPLLPGGEVRNIPDGKRVQISYKLHVYALHFLLSANRHLHH